MAWYYEPSNYSKMKLKNCFYLLSILCLLCIQAVSCESDKTTEFKIPHAEFTYSSTSSYGTFLTNGADFQFTLALDEEKSSEGLRITQIDYYWDDQKVTTVGGMNLTMTYHLQNETLGEHHLKVVARCSGEGYSTVTYTMELPFTVCEQIPVIDFTCPNIQSVNHNGLLECNVQPVEGIASGASISKVAYYLDDRLLLETAMAPYTLSCPVKNEKLGEHKFAVRVTFQGLWDGQITRTYPITIQ